MGLGHSPRIVTDGLVLALDAQNSKSWKSGTTWTDASRNGNDVTLTGGISHSDGPFPEAGYVEFDGSTEYLSIADSADFDMSSSIYTWELWFYTTDIGSGEGSGGYGGLFSKCTASSSVTYGLGFDSSGNLFFKYWNGSGTVTTQATTTIVTGKWYHVAVVKDAASATSGNTKIFVNGNLEATTAVSGTFYSESSNPLEIGRDSRSTTDYFQGYISNLRAVKGTALYTSDFTPPSSPLTAVTNTKLLCCQGGTNVDASPSAHSFQVIIGVPTLTSVGPSATKYFEFDGTDDYVNAPVTKAASCTFSCWAKSTNVNGKMLFNAGGSGPDLFFYNSNVSWNTFDGDDNAFASTPASATDGNWHYYVVVNDASSNAKLYYDGELLGTATYRNASANTNLTIGGSTSTYQWNGSISSFQLHNKVLTAAEVEQNYNATKGRYV
jgi:hypothetical protein